MYRPSFRADNPPLKLALQLSGITLGNNWECMADKKLSEILAYEVERIAFAGTVYSEATLTLQIHPLTFLQLLAWRGVAHIGEHEILRVVDWDSYDSQLIEELSRILFTSFARLIFGEQEHTGGPWVLRNVSTQAKVEEGGIIRLPEHSEIKKRGRVVERVKVL